MKKIAMIGSIYENGWNILKENNYDVFEINDFSKENLKKELSDVVAIGLRTAEINEEILIECKNLEIISRHGVGYDSVDLNYLNKNKQALAITGTSNAISVAEHVMTMFLILTKQINKSDKLVKEGNFKEKKVLPDFFELYQKNILIMGFGRIGQALAKRCLGFEANVYVYDPFKKKEKIEKLQCIKINFEDGIKIADLLSIHMPLNKDTKNLITKNQFNQMKKNCIVVNTARGGIINEEDLAWALSNDKIYGAGLDVFTQEPPKPDNPLLKMNNIILSPHNAALTLECRKRMAKETAENIQFYLGDRSKLNKNNIVNRNILEL